MCARILRRVSSVGRKITWPCSRHLGQVTPSLLRVCQDKGRYHARRLRDKIHYRVYVDCGRTNNESSASVLLLAQSPSGNDAYKRLFVCCGRADGWLARRHQILVRTSVHSEITFPLLTIRPISLRHFSGMGVIRPDEWKAFVNTGLLPISIRRWGDRITSGLPIMQTEAVVSRVRRTGTRPVVIMPITTVTLLCCHRFVGHAAASSFGSRAICRSEGAALVPLGASRVCFSLILSAFVGMAGGSTTGQDRAEQWRSEGPRISGLRVDAPYDFSYRACEVI